MGRTVKHHFATPPRRHRYEAKFAIELDKELKKILAVAGKVLDEAGIPELKDAQQYEQEADLSDHLTALGFDYEGREGFAARIAFMTFALDRDRVRGNMDGAILLAVALGALLAQAAMHPEWERGFGMLKRLAEATDIHWGPRDERRARDAKIRNIFEEERKKSSTSTAAYRAAALRAAAVLRANVTWRKVRRVVTGH